MNKKTFDEGIESIEIAFKLIEFSYRIQATCGNKGIRTLFHNDLEVKGVVVEGEKLSIQDADRFFANHLNGAICCFWIAVDEALENAFEKKYPERRSYLDDFRSVIFMFRCAFAHGIAEPKWAVNNPICRRTYQLNVPTVCQRGGVHLFSFDFGKLNGQNVKTDDFKHFRGLLTFSQMALQLLKDAQRKLPLEVTT